MMRYKVPVGLESPGCQYDGPAPDCNAFFPLAGHNAYHAAAVPGQQAVQRCIAQDAAS
jgi:hypothetical protein